MPPTPAMKIETDRKDPNGHAAGRKKIMFDHVATARAMTRPGRGPRQLRERPPSARDEKRARGG